MTVYPILFLLFILQFVYLPIGTSFFEGSKVWFATGIIIILFFIRLLFKGDIVIGNYKRLYLFSCLFIFIVSFLHVFIDATKTVLFGNMFRLQGTVLLWLLLLFSFASAGINIQKKSLPLVGIIILFIQLVCSILIIGVGTDRPIGTIGEPNALAASVLGIWPFVYFITVKDINKKWWMRSLSLFFVVTILILSGSRSGVIAFALQLIFLLLHRIFSKKLFLVTIVSFILLFVSYIFPLLSKGDLYENRAEIWVSALYAGIKHPIIGVGFGNTEYALHDATVQLHNHLPGYYIDSSHNIFLDWWVEGGIICLGFFIYLLWQTITTFVSQGSLLNIVLLLGIIASLSFNPASIVSLLMLWWLVGQSALKTHNRK